MQELDSDESVTSWEYEFTSIEYELGGKRRRYVPDFHVVHGDRHELVEVKPTQLRNTVMNEAKRLAAQEYCDKEGWSYIEWSPFIEQKLVKCL